MKVDWFTVAAQAINFFLLVWLLKRFLYKPILSAIDAREQKIRSQLEEAEVNKAAAAQAQAEFRQKNEVFDEQRNMLMDKVEAEATEERDRLMEKARQDATAERTRLEHSLAELQESIYKEVGQQIQHEVFSITRQTLTDLASATLEEQIVQRFIELLQQLSGKEKEQFLSSFKSGGHTLIVRSAFSLSAEQKSDIQKVVGGMINTTAALQFEEDPALISGVALIADGYILSWNVSAYMGSLQKSIADTTRDAQKPVSEQK